MIVSWFLDCKALHEWQESTGGTRRFGKKRKMYKDDLEFNDPSKHVDAFLSGADLSCFNQEARKRKKLEKQRSIPKSPADMFQPAYVVNQEIGILQ